jgi:hypothetical protein
LIAAHCHILYTQVVNEKCQCLIKRLLEKWFYCLSGKSAQ